MTDIVNKILQDKKDWSLIYAVKDDNPQSVLKALELGANPDTNDHDGTALSIACRHGQCEIVKHLLEAGADANKRELNGNAPFKIIVTGGNELGNGKNYVEIVRMLIKYGACTDIKNHWGDSALHYAAIQGNAPMTQVMIDAGVDINAKNFNGDTSLIYASYSRHTDVMDILAEAGADINIKNDDGQTVRNILDYYYPGEYSMWVNGLEIRARRKVLEREDAERAVSAEREPDFNL